jgi:hypothetical protein
VLSLVILGAMLGNLIFQSTCSETVNFKTDGQCFQNVGALSPAGTMHHQAVVALSIVRTCPGTNGLSRLIPERKKVE